MSHSQTPTAENSWKGSLEVLSSGKSSNVECNIQTVCYDNVSKEMLNFTFHISHFTFIHISWKRTKVFRCKFKHHEFCEIQLPLIYGSTHLTLCQTLLKVLHGLFLLSCWLLAVLGNHQWAPNEELDLCQLMNGLWMLWISALKDLSLQEQSLWSGWHLGRSSSSPPHTLTRT